MNELEVRNVLLTAKQRLLGEGWIRSAFYTDNNGYCLAGAMGFPFAGRAGSEALELVATCCPGLVWMELRLQDGTRHRLSTCQAIALWNDASDRTIDDVIAAIDSALLALDEMTCDAERATETFALSEGN